MIVFENKGSIDLRAVTTFGVSSKTSDSAIGYFGTGLKYAIAICLREGCEITLVTAGKRYEFAYTTDKIRLHEFQIVTMNGEPLGFTLDLGKTWELWQAYRELWCNAVDEGGVVHQLPDHDCEGTGDGDTYLVVRGQKFEDVHNCRRDYFLVDYKPTVSDGVTHAVRTKRSSGRFCYKGIRVAESNLPVLYDYNFLEAKHCDLTEDRTMKYGFEQKWNVQALIQQTEDREYLREVLTAAPGTFEGCLDFGNGCRSNIKYGDTFMEVMGELRRERKDQGINVSALLLHRRKVEHSVLPTKSIRLNGVERAQLKRARKFCTEVLELQLDKFPLIVVADLGKNSLGRADFKTKTMYMSRLCFAQGTKRVAAALLEEFTHLEHLVEDETSEQKWVYLEQILSLGERLQGEPL